VPYAIISDVKAGHWYQFRVAAVNIYGSRGWSAPSQPFTLSKGLNSLLLTDIRYFNVQSPWWIVYCIILTQRTNYCEFKCQ